MMPRFFRAAPAVLAALLALSGCNSDRRFVNCPGAAILADLATRPALKPGAPPTDPASVLYKISLVNIETTCTLDIRKGEVESSVGMTFRATRAPSGQAAHYAVPYFLAINQAERIINKRQFTAQLDFPAGAASVTFETAVDSTTLKMENGHLPTDYQYLAGLDLSDSERACVAAMGPYTP
jgi:hypothetical protein